MLCRVLKVSRSGYYYQTKNSSNRIQKDSADLAIIKKHFTLSRGKAGIITLEMILRRHGHHINHKKIARIKREYNLVTKIRRKRPYKGIQLNSKVHPQIPNLLKRDFIQPIPDQAYSTDMTYLFYGACQKAYLSATKDLCTNEIVSYKLMKSPALSVFTDEFKVLLGKIPQTKRENLIIHSDQGYQYTHQEFIKVLKDAGVKQSMSRRGNCLDNAPIETFFGHFKDLAEIKKCKTYEEVEAEVDSVMNYYNYERPQRGLNKKPPAECRELLESF